jgi:tetratricopeptide (TPR) repeat protein
VEGEVAGAIAEQLNAKLTGAEKQELAIRPTNNPAAYDAYLRGLPNMARATEPESLKAAIHSFDEAVRLDPQFALAWAALSRTQSLAYFNDFDKTESTKVAAEKALAEAIRLQPNLSEAQLARADFHYWVLLDYKTARDELEQLHQSWPSNAEVLQVLGWISARLGDWKKSANYLDEAIALNPRDLYLRATGYEIWMSLRDFPTALRKLDGALETFPNDPALLTLKVCVLQGQGQLDEAQSIVNRLNPGESYVDTLGTIAYQAMLRRTPAVAFKYFEGLENKSNLTTEEINHLLNLADLVEQSGDKTRSQALFTRALELTPDNKYLLFDRGYALAALGQRNAALAALDKMSALTEKDARFSGTSQEFKARILSRFGDKDQAIPLLQHLLEIPYDGFNVVPLTPALLRLDPAFDSLRGDPRFEKLCQEPAK